MCEEKNWIYSEEVKACYKKIFFKDGVFDLKGYLDKDDYGKLGLNKDATQEEIELRKKLLLILHTDKKKEKDYEANYPDLFRLSKEESDEIFLAFKKALDLR